MGFKIPKAAYFIALLVLVFAAVWGFLNLFHSPYADWLTVETPRYAVVGSPMDVRITLGNVPERSLLVVNIYLLGKNHKAVGRLPAPSPPLPAQSGRTYSFRFDVTEKEKMAFVQLVIWVSPMGDWRTRTHGASTIGIPVKWPEERAGIPGFQKVRVFSNQSSPNPEIPFQPGGRPPEPEVLPKTFAPIQLVLLALLVSGGLACLANAARRRSGRLPDGTGEWRFWFGAAAVLFLAVFWEAFHVSGRLSIWGRKMIEGMDIYYARQSYQRTLLALIAAGSACLLILTARAIARKRVPPHLTAVGALLAFYLGGSLAGALSFHYVDVLRGVVVAGISVVDAVKAICAGAVLLLSLLALRCKKALNSGRKHPIVNENNMI
jgi:hypothetical protein